MRIYLRKKKDTYRMEDEIEEYILHGWSKHRKWNITQKYTKQIVDTVRPYKKNGNISKKKRTIRVVCKFEVQVLYNSHFSWNPQKSAQTKSIELNVLALEYRATM